MKALLITHDFPPALPGGISMYYHQLALGLAEEIAVLAPAGPGSEAFDASQPFRVHRPRIPVVPPAFMRERGVRFRLLRMARVALAQLVGFYRSACRLIEAEGADVALIGHLYLGPLGPLIRRRTGVRYGVLLHGSELHRYMAWSLVRRTMLRALNSADFLVVNSGFTHRQYLDRGLRAEQRVLKLNPGVDVSRLRPGAGDPGKVRQRHGLGDRPVLLSVARLVEWKGQDTVLSALPRVRAVFPRVVYLLAGDGPYRPELEQMAADLGLQDAVIFAGFVDAGELPSYYGAADVMVVPSREFAGRMPVEGFGMVFVEAGACAVPVIGGCGGGTEESIADGITGFRVDPHDPAAIADAVIRTLSDPELAARMGRAGRERAKALDWSRQAACLQEFLHRLVDEEGRHPVSQREAGR